MPVISADAHAIGRRLDALAIGPFHRRLMALIGGGMFFDAFDNFLAGGVLAALVHSGESDVQRNAQFISWGFAGLMIGAMAAGMLGDRFGRRFSYQANLLIFGLASLAAAVAPSMGWVIALRFVMGLGLGAEIVVGYTTLSEFVPAYARGRYTSILNLITNSSLFVSAAASYILIPNVGWRWMFVIPGLGALIVWYLRKALPESPRWLASRGRASEAERVTAAIERESVTRDGGVEAAPIVEDNGRFAELFAPGQLTLTLLGAIVIVTSFSVMYAFVAWMPTFLVNSGLAVSNSLLLTSVMFAGAPVGSLVSFAIADRVGRRWGLILASAVGAVFAFAYPYVTSIGAIVTVGFVVTTCIYVTSALGVACYVTELFPTRLRLRGVGFCNALGRAANIGVPYLVAGSYGFAGLKGVVTVMIILFLVMIVALLAFGIETRHQSLETVEKVTKGPELARSAAGVSQIP